VLVLFYVEQLALSTRWLLLQAVGRNAAQFLDPQFALGKAGGVPAAAGGRNYSASDWAATFDSCFELYGGLQACEELEQLSSECAHVCNRWGNRLLKTDSLWSPAPSQSRWRIVPWWQGLGVKQPRQLVACEHTAVPPAPAVSHSLTCCNCYATCSLHQRGMGSTVRQGEPHATGPCLLQDAELQGTFCHVPFTQLGRHLVCCSAC
jgi:hypothetical protein